MADHLPCVGCAYDLHCRAPEDECPECGTAVAASIAAGPHRLGDPVWLGRLRTGAWLTIVGMCLHFPLLCVTIRPAVIGPLLSSLLAGVGLLLLTAPDPARFADTEYQRRRVGARIFGLVLIASAPALALTQSLSLAWTILTVGRVALTAVTAWAVAAYLVLLALWQSNPKLARETRGARNVVLGAIAVIIVFGAAITIAHFAQLTGATPGPPAGGTANTTVMISLRPVTTSRLWLIPLVLMAAAMTIAYVWVIYVIYRHAAQLGLSVRRARAAAGDQSPGSL